MSKHDCAELELARLVRLPDAGQAGSRGADRPEGIHYHLQHAPKEITGNTLIHKK